MVDNEILLIDQEIDKTPAKIRFDQANDGEGLLRREKAQRKSIKSCPVESRVIPLG